MPFRRHTVVLPVIAAYVRCLSGSLHIATRQDTLQLCTHEGGQPGNCLRTSGIYKSLLVQTQGK
jgi:hypothetical protein